MDLWGDLGRDLLQLIAERVTGHKDLLQFGAVCTNWRYVVVDNIQKFPRNMIPLGICLPPQQPFPLLMQYYFENDSAVVDFTYIPTQKIYRRLVVPEIYGKFVCGSFNGWVFVNEFDRCQCYLLNPLTRAQIPLPFLRTFPGNSSRYRTLKKVVLLSPLSRRNKLGNDWIVACICPYKREIFICRRGSDKWTHIVGSHNNLFDAIPHQGQIYAVDELGKVVAFDVANDQQIAHIAGKTPCNMSDDSDVSRYLVESVHGDLLQVVRIRNKYLTTVRFHVYRLAATDDPQIDEMGPKYSRGWVEVESLDEQILFLGLNCSMSLSAKTNPSCQGNCIYFTDDNMGKRLAAHTYTKRNNLHLYRPDWLRKYDMAGIYDMNEKSVFPIREMNDKYLSFPAVWVVPNPW